MSYILDALRKSEHERQVAAGQSVGMLYPIEIEQSHKLWPILIALILTALITCAVTWWLWSKPVVTEVSHTMDKTAATIVSQPYVASVEVLSKSQPESKPKANKLILEPKAKKMRAQTLTNNEKATPTLPDTTPKTAAIINQTVSADPLKDLPALNITGFIHNAESGNLAMINNQLVHEGDEVSPGLRLVKVLDDSAIFSYKGFVFSR